MHEIQAACLVRNLKETSRKTHTLESVQFKDKKGQFKKSKEKLGK